MRRRDNIKDVEELRKMLTETKKLTLEGFIMPEEEESSFEEEMPIQKEEPQEMPMRDTMNIEKELTQIRKITLSVINRLADQPTSESYDIMKKIWNMVDKAIEQPKNNDSYQE